MTAREEFLAGERLEDVLIFLSDGVLSNPDALADHAETVPDGGVVLVLPGEKARSVFQNATGIDPMVLPQQTGDREGDIRADLTDGSCPEAQADDGSHDTRFIFAFAEGENPEAGGLYAEGDVVHAYAACECGTKYSHRWVVGERVEDRQGGSS